MEPIKEALRKVERQPGIVLRPNSNIKNLNHGSISAAHSDTYNWVVPELEPDPKILERHRIVSHTKTDPSHVAFDILRTKTFQAMQERGWKSLAICSASAGCGKTNVAVNLAFSMARLDNCRTVLIDLDLKRPSVERTVGLMSARPLGHYLEDNTSLEESFVRVGDNLFFALNSYQVRNSAEMMRTKKVRDILPMVLDHLNPTMVIFDLPPMLASDDAIAFLSEVDCGLLVVESGKTTANQIEDSAQHFEGRTEFLGVVLNKCRESADKNYI